VGLSPAANEPADFIKAARSMFVTAQIQMTQFRRQAKKDTQLLDAKVGGNQFVRAGFGVGGLDQTFEHVERGCLDAITEKKFLTARKFLDGGYQPKLKAIRGFESWTRASSYPPPRLFPLRSSQVRSAFEQ